MARIRGMGGAADLFPDFESPRAVRSLPPVRPVRRQREGFTILEYVVGAAAGCIVGIASAWMAFGMLFNLQAPSSAGSLLYLCMPGIPIATVVLMKIIGKVQL